MSTGRTLNELKNSFQIKLMIRIRGINPLAHPFQHFAQKPISPFQYRSTFSKTYVYVLPCRQGSLNSINSEKSFKQF